MGTHLMAAHSKTIGPGDAGQRLDRYLKRVCAGVPFVGLQKAIRTGLVRVNGRKAPMDLRLQARDVVTLPPDFLSASTNPSAAYTPTKAELAALKASIVYEDGQVLVLNKPQGLPSQAGGGQVKSLDRLLAAAYGPEKIPKLVHRLDRETTGLILCGKTRTAAAALSEQWASRAVIKGYLALVLASKLPAKGEMQRPIDKRGPLAVIDEINGDPAHTQYVNLGQLEPGVFAVLALPRTGRMNQIRVHFANNGWPLVGDDKYGDFAQTKAAGKQLKTGLALHAWRLHVVHPQANKFLTLEAPLPFSWQGILTASMLEQAAQAWQTFTNNKG